MILGVLLLLAGIILGIFAIKAMHPSQGAPMQRVATSGCDRCGRSQCGNNNTYYSNGNGYNYRGAGSQDIGTMTTNVMKGRATRHEAKIVWALVGAIALVILGGIIIIASRMGHHPHHARKPAKEVFHRKGKSKRRFFKKR